MTLSGAPAPDLGETRGEAPKAGFILLVALVLLVGILTVVSGFFISENVSDSPPEAVIEVHTNSNGTIVVAHRSGDTIDTEHLRLTGPVAEAQPFESETFSPGDRLLSDLEEQGTVEVVWEDEDGNLRVTLERFDLSSQGE